MGQTGVIGDSKKLLFTGNSFTDFRQKSEAFVPK
jgi:hypothetical protein